MLRAGFTIAIALLLAGCGLLGGGGTTYPVAVKEARAKLLLTAPPLYLFGSGVDHTVVSRDGDGTVRWLLVDKLGTGLLTLAATTEAAGPQKTRIAVSIEPPLGGRHDEVARGLAENSPIADFYKAAMAEQIDAAFEHREFDMAAIERPMIAAAIANAPRIASEMDRAARKSEADDRANVEQAARDEAQRGWSDSSDEAQEPAYGEPMDSADSRVTERRRAYPRNSAPSLTAAATIRSAIAFSAASS